MVLDQALMNDDMTISYDVMLWQNFTSYQADKSYTASVVLDGAELSYFGQEGMQEVVVGESKVKCTTGQKMCRP